MTKGFYEYGADREERMVGTKCGKTDDDNAYFFLFGLSTVFALVLHEQFGYPILVLHDAEREPAFSADAPVICEKMYGDVRYFIDACGITDSEDTLLEAFEDYCIDTPAYDQVDPAKLEKDMLELVGKDCYTKYKEQARSLIKGFQDYYTL